MTRYSSVAAKGDKSVDFQKLHKFCQKLYVFLLEKSLIPFKIVLLPSGRKLSCICGYHMPLIFHV